MLEKTYRVIQILNYYSECNYYEQTILKEVVKCYIEGMSTFNLTKSDFVAMIDDEVTPTEAFKAMHNVNSMLCYTFTFNFEYKDSDTWSIDAEMIDRVWYCLDSTL